MADERQDFEERRQRLRAQRDEARARADVAEVWILDHLKALLPDGRQVLLRAPELATFKLHTVNVVLSRLGYEGRAKMTDTPAAVVTEIAPQSYAQRSRFRLVRVVSGVVTAEEDEDAGTLAETSPDGTTV